MNLFAPQYWYFWAIALALALFIPVRQLIWVMSVRRAERKSGPADDKERARLKRRASVTSGLLCALFSLFYTMHLFAPPS